MENQQELLFPDLAQELETMEDQREDIRGWKNKDFVEHEWMIELPNSVFVPLYKGSKKPTNSKGETTIYVLYRYLYDEIPPSLNRLYHGDERTNHKSPIVAFTTKKDLKKYTDRYRCKKIKRLYNGFTIYYDITNIDFWMSIQENNMKQFIDKLIQKFVEREEEEINDKRGNFGEIVFPFTNNDNKIEFRIFEENTDIYTLK